MRPVGDSGRGRELKCASVCNKNSQKMEIIEHHCLFI